ncbi:MAG: S1 RNA-binding domain-containing protein [Oscillospiraceae bacterium]
MKFKKASIFTTLVIAVLMVYALISLFVVHRQTRQLQDRAATLQQQVSEMTQANAELQYQIDHSEDDDMIESVAREKLGLVKPGEKIFTTRVIEQGETNRMQVEVGAVVEGTVTGITKFGAFVSLPDGRSGLVHISEIANTYVNDVNEFLKLGDKVKVRVLAVTPDGKINLSIKKAEPAPERPNNRPMHGGRPGGNRPNNNGGAPRAARPNNRSAQPAGQVSGPSGDAAFEDRLKQFMQESDSRMAGNRLYSDRTRGRRRGSGRG